MRGARLKPTSRHGSPGIIPADAGSTPKGTCFAFIYRDHPRGCGEHETAFHTVNREEGSSPRMQGAHGEKNTKDNK